MNGGGRVEREYGLGRKRTDLLVIWPVQQTDAVQKAVIELKVVYRSVERTVTEGLDQTAAYMERCATAEGHLVVFDRDALKSWDEKIFRRAETYEGKTITVWGM